MEKRIYRRYPFWSLAGPLLGFLAIQSGVSSLIRFAIELPYMLRAYGEIMGDPSVLSVQQIADLYVQALEPAVEIFAAYQIEIAAVSSLATVILTGIMFAGDRKLEKKAGVQISEKIPLRKYWTLAAFGITASVAATCLMAMVQAVFYDTRYQQTSSEMYSSPLFVQIICLGIVIPVAEEFLFRGVLFKRYRERRNFVYSAVGSSLIFGLMHASTTQMIYAFLMGLMLAYVYEKFGSFRAPVFLHIVANLASVVFTEAGVFAQLAQDVALMAGVIIFGAFISSAVFVLIQRNSYCTNKNTI